MLSIAVIALLKMLSLITELITILALFLFVAKILLFYVIFYAALAGFFAAMLAVFYQTLDENKPKWQLDNGLIGSNPGLGFRPMPPESNVESTLVWFEASNPKNTEYWVGALDEFLHCKLFFYLPIYRAIQLIKLFPLTFLVYTMDKKLIDKDVEKNRMDCDFNKHPTDGRVCRVEVSPQNYGICTPDNKYGYNKGSPCVFLKLNKVKKTVFN